MRLLPEAQKQRKMAEKKIPLKRKALLESQVHKFLNSGFKFVVYSTKELDIEIAN
jgi:hypothetical protein